MASSSKQEQDLHSSQPKISARKPRLLDYYYHRLVGLYEILDEHDPSGHAKSYHWQANGPADEQEEDS